MRNQIRLILTLAGLVLSIMMPAQELPSLPVDKAIKKGVLNCGVTYYMIPGTSERGSADFALIRRDDVPTAETRAELSELEAFLTRYGVGLRSEGRFQDLDGSTVIRFDRVPVYNTTALDSTLLLSFNLMARSRADQALVISGDVDAADVKRKMDLFSMTVPPVYKRKDGPSDYVWESSVSPFLYFRKTPGPLSEVRVTYVTARTPQKYMNTAQTLVMDLFAREMGTLLDHRLRRRLRSAGIPFYDIRFEHQGSSRSAGDEKYTVVVGTDDAHMDATMQVVARMLASFEAFGAQPGEFREMKRVLDTDMVRRGDARLTNGEYVDRCIASFLFGSDLAPYSEETKLFSGKMVADTTDRRLFNGIAAAVFDQSRNLTIDLAAPRDSVDEYQALFDYNLAYLLGSTVPPEEGYAWHRGDTLGLPDRFPRVKIKSEKPEPVSGGTMWTFSNGMRVIFRQMPGSGMFSYALQLNGGATSIPGLEQGEAGYIEQMLRLYNTGGLTAEAFGDMLRANGIGMETDVFIRDMAISGSAPRQKLPLLLRSLVSLATDRVMNEDAFAHFLSCEALRLPWGAFSEKGMNARLQDILCPDYRYTFYRDPSRLGPALRERADAYYTDRFTAVNDGVLILAGDLDPDGVKKLLCRTLGGFPTTKNPPRRPSVRYSPLSGTRTQTVSGPAPEIAVMMTAEYPLTAVNNYAVEIAAEAMRRSLVRSLSGTGLTVSVVGKFTPYPQERMWMTVRCAPADPAGFPEGVAAGEIADVLPKVREGIARAAESFGKTEVDAWKKRVQGRMEDAFTRPDRVVSTVVIRYAMGKDMVSDYKNNIASITPATVGGILDALAGGGRIEYIVKP
jgi:hypothetical protein